jgi:hippurate hydrolase
MSHELLDQARALLPEVITLRRKLHAQPELGNHLPQTKAAVLDALSELALPLWHSTRTSGLVATLRGAHAGPTLLLRADMDALPMPEDTGLPFASQVPGAMHACGHDAHTAMLVGAARLLAARKHELHGTVKLMFQPGEEGHFGAREMVEEGILEHEPRVDAAFALHVAPVAKVGQLVIRPGPMFASNDDFAVELIGKGGHASMPHLAIDPIPALCELVLALQALTTRRVNALDMGVLTVGKVQAGTTTNVIPERAEITGTVRSFSARTRHALVQGLERVTHGIAAAHELEAKVRWAPGYPVVHNDPGFTEFVRATASDVLGADRVPEGAEPVMGAEDFSYVLERVPGAMGFLGMRPRGEGPAANIHSNRMLLDEDGLAFGIALHAGLALRLLDGQAHTFR